MGAGRARPLLPDDFRRVLDFQPVAAGEHPRTQLLQLRAVRELNQPQLLTAGKRLSPDLLNASGNGNFDSLRPVEGFIFNHPQLRPICEGPFYRLSHPSKALSPIVCRLPGRVCGAAERALCERAVSDLPQPRARRERHPLQALAAAERPHPDLLDARREAHFSDAALLELLPPDALHALRQREHDAAAPGERVLPDAHQLRAFRDRHRAQTPALAKRAASDAPHGGRQQHLCEPGAGKRLLSDFPQLRAACKLHPRQAPAPVEGALPDFPHARRQPHFCDRHARERTVANLPQLRIRRKRYSPDGLAVLEGAVLNGLDTRWNMYFVDSGVLKLLVPNIC